ncbi:MAG: tetratricopeptide repeat protein [Bacteroidota bacterium]
MKTLPNFIKQLATFLWFAMFLLNSFGLFASSDGELKTHYDSIRQVLIGTTNPADFDAFYEAVSLDEHFPDDLKYELVLITTKRAKELGFEYAYAKGIFIQSIYKTIGGEYDEAISMATTSLEIFQSLNKYIDVASCYNTMGSTLTANGDPEIGKKYLKMAVKENERAVDSEAKEMSGINNLIVLGYVYYHAGQLDSAEVFTLQALQKAERGKFIKETAYCYVNLGKFQLKRENYEEALAFYKKGLQVIKQGADLRIRAIFHHRIGQVFQLTQRWEDALTYFDRGLNICENHFTFLPIWVDLLEIKAGTLEQTGNYAAALNTKNQYIMLKDSLMNVKREKAHQKLQIEFKVRQKDQEIASLNQQATIQSLKLSERNNQLMIGGLGAIVLLLGGFLYYQNDRNRKAKTANELEQRFLRSQLNPHFIFNSMIAIQRYLIERNNAEETSHYMGTFSSLMREILENSRESFITLKKEVNLLTKYLELQKMRFKDRFDYDIVIDENLDLVYHGVPPMFAQPFIENALEHGLFRKQADNKLTIKFEKVGSDRVALYVTDNGVGMEAADHHSDHQSLATQITRERLASLKKANGKVGFSANNIKNAMGEIEGFRVHLTLPTQLLTAR